MGWQVNRYTRDLTRLSVGRCAWGRRARTATRRSATACLPAAATWCLRARRVRSSLPCSKACHCLDRKLLKVPHAVGSVLDNVCW